MPTYTLTPTQLAAYAKLFDYRTQFVQAARQILSAGGIAAAMPGDGDQQIPRTYNSLDFAVGGADASRKIPVALGGGRYREYGRFTGTLTLMVCVPIEEVQAAGDQLTVEHLRELDRITSTARVLFMEHLEPFSATLLPNLDVQALVPIEPDERPEEAREVNTARLRWRLTFELRPNAWPSL
ncbi:MAG: hypothetical protein H7343_12310 [Undibacterium sp.]|nr:hypothetical protein [Opitutaceae bacterium]